MLKTYNPEINEVEPTTINTKQVKHLTVYENKPIIHNAKLSQDGRYYYVRTPLELKGRGITKTDEDTYRMTINAFNKFCKQHDVKMKTLLD